MRKDGKRRGYARLVIGRAAYTIARRLVHPRAYAAAGIPPQAGRAAALTNPRFRETLRWAGRKPYATCTDSAWSPVPAGLSGTGPA